MKNDKLIFRIVMAVSIFVFITVVILNRKIIPRPAHIPEFVYSLPAVNGFINGTCALLLCLSLYFIKKKNITLHKKINFAAFILSSLFLVCYITYHWLAEETSYPADNGLRPLYLTILISHIILAALVLPLVLMSFYRGIQNQIALHKKLVRWTWPIWFYVCVTGVVIYLMISPYYTH
jgi:putative membrane protein